MRTRSPLSIQALFVLSSALSLSSHAWAQPDDLLLSEYVEGSSSDKAIEIFNGTGATADLAAYQLELYVNGDATPTSLIPLSGSLPDSDVFVIANSLASFSGEPFVDEISGSIAHSGDDAYVLRHLPTNSVVDSFGRVGEDPGSEWPAPNGGTGDNTLRREATVCAGDTDPGDLFDGGTEWDGYGVNALDGLGNHAVSCGVIVINEILADPAAGTDVNGDGTASSSDDEFVEIVNVSDGDVDLSGWTLTDNAQLRHTFPLNTVVSAGCGVLVFGGGSPTGSFGGMIVQVANSGILGLGLNNGGDSVTVADGSAVVAEKVYGREAGADQSITRDPDVTGAFVQHTAASGSGGSAFSPGTRVDGSDFAGCSPPAADVAVSIETDDFLDAEAQSVQFTIVVTNQGPDVALGDVAVMDDSTISALTNRQWTCLPPAGAICSPISGIDQVLAGVGDLGFGQSALIDVTADLVDPNSDQQFIYGASASGAEFTTDPALANNSADVVIQTGIFADSFELPQ